MKKLKLGEAIDVILQDKDAELESGDFELYWHYTYGIVILYVPTMDLFTGQEVWNHTFTSREWSVIEEPLSFMEVVRLGGKFKVESKMANGLVSSNGMSLTQFLGDLSKNLTDERTRHVLISGEFYPQ